MKHSEQVADYINSLIIQHLQPITKSRDETLGKLKKALSFLDDNNESSEIKAISRESDLDYIKEIEKIIDKKFEEMNLEEILSNKIASISTKESPVRIEVYRGVDKGISYSSATLPEKKTPKATGYDAFACFPDGFDKEVTIHPGKTAKIPLGLSFKIPEGYEIQVRPRSGISFKQNVHVILGSIDEDYRGVVSAIIVNLSNNPVVINDNTAICQLVVSKKIPSELILMEGTIDTDTERGTGGFGHTGNMGD